MCGLFVDTGSTLPKETLLHAFDKIAHRGPDSTVIRCIQSYIYFLFHRLAIIDTTSLGNQPFETDFAMLTCNGEIYNYMELKKQCTDYNFTSHSDCEVILPLYKRWGMQKLCTCLDAEFVFVLYDKMKKEFFAARDVLGIRPLFYGVASNGRYLFASEAKALHSICKKITPFPPGHYWSESQGFVCYQDVTNVMNKYETNRKKATLKIKEYLTEAVRKRLQSDVPVGFFLSGGVDSSLICAIATHILKQPIRTFSVGIDTNPIDIKYAKAVAEYIKSDHYEYTFSLDEALSHLPNIIYHLESYDITTIRASIGMYLLSQYIRQKTDTKVLLTGEVSDELFGYKYTDFAPSSEAFQQEAQKRIKEIYMYDVLRCDRCVSGHALEARVPFGDHAFSSFVFHIDPRLKVNNNGIGKSLLREAFAKDNLLPQHILFREKAAFSDAVGHALVDGLKKYATTQYTAGDLQQAKEKYPYATPKTAEALLYRDIFEKFYPGQSHWIKGFWMPNPNWKHCSVEDPSARVLPNYNQSGH